MKALSLHQEFDITVYETDEWVLDTHKHTFFELVYIIKGKGVHLLNGNDYEYKKGSLFFLTPDDYHSFKITNKTAFCIITFNKIYFSKAFNPKDGLHNFIDIFKKIEIIFYNSSYFQNKPIRNNEDEIFIKTLIRNLIKEMKVKRIFYELNIQNSVFLLLNIIARNIHENLSTDFKKNKPKSDIGDILAYIQQNIYSKEKLKIETIASHFYKSKNYIGQYFKSETGETIKNYILKYKINLVKNRLIYSNFTILQIANELEYTDESHLNKTFKHFFGKTAKQYRKELLSKIQT